MLPVEYFAGLFDGEGSFSIINHHRTGKFYPLIQITMLDNDMLRELIPMFGGRVNYHHANSGKRTIRGVWNGSKAEVLLAAIGPHLRVKHQQAAILMEYLRHGKDHDQGARFAAIVRGLNRPGGKMRNVD